MRIAALACSFALVAALMPHPVVAEEAEVSETIARGRWEGEVRLPYGNVDLIVDLRQNAKSEWKGKVHMPKQGVRNAEVEQIQVDADVVFFAIPGVPGEPFFRGRVAADGNSLAGQLEQLGQSFPLRLSRGELPDEESDPYAEFDKPGEPGQGLEGRWLGLLSMGAARMRLVLEVTLDEQGQLSSTLDNLDTDRLDIPVSHTSLEDHKMWFKINDQGVVYEGELNEDGSEIVGEWRQRGRKVDATFRRNDGA